MVPKDANGAPFGECRALSGRLATAANATASSPTACTFPRAHSEATGRRGGGAAAGGGACGTGGGGAGETEGGDGCAGGGCSLLGAGGGGGAGSGSVSPAGATGFEGGRGAGGFCSGALAACSLEPHAVAASTSRIERTAALVTPSG